MSETLQSGIPSINRFNINGTSFNPDDNLEIKKVYILAPSVKGTDCGIQTLVKVFIKKADGSFIDFRCDLIYMFNNDGNRPMLQFLISLSDRALSNINNVFSDGIFEKLGIRFTKEIKMNLPGDIEEIIKQMDEVYPLKKQ